MTQITRAKVEYAYEYVRKNMVGNPAFTNSMVADTLRNIDQAYFRLLRCERRGINTAMTP